MGFIFFVVGVVLAYNPELISNKPVPEATFEAVERRVKWGIIIGIGILFMFHHQLKPWLLTTAATGSAITLGILVARFIGIVLDGSVIKQWYWVGVELAVLIMLSIWYAKQST